jgi:hypothetical protein
MTVSKGSVTEVEARGGGVRVIAPTPCRMEEEVASGAATGEVGADMVDEVKRIMKSIGLQKQVKFT